MGHLWMVERPPFSAFKDSLIAYFILSFFPKRHLWSKAPLHANAFFYDIFEERTLGLSILSLSFWEWKKFLFFVTFATHIWRLKRSLECYHFSGRQLSYKCFGHTRLSSFCSFLWKRISEKVREGDSYNCRIVVIVVPSKRKNFQVFLGDSTLEWAFKFLVHFWQWTIDFSHQKW